METGSGSSESSTMEQLPRLDHCNQMAVIEGCDESCELDLGLGLTLCSAIHNKNQLPRINGDFPGGVVSPPSSASSSSSLTAHNSIVSPRLKRPASPTSLSQVVGWPPIRTYRMNNMTNQAKSITDEHNTQFDEDVGKEAIYGGKDKGNAYSQDRAPSKSSLFVKVNMDGVAIGRKVDLTLYVDYESLAQTLEDMFTNRAAEKSNAEELILLPKVTRPSRLLDGLSEYVLTYEDKDGDWMLVGDVPWGMFVGSVKRLRIMRTSEANGLAPRLEERSVKQRNMPI